MGTKYDCGCRIVGHWILCSNHEHIIINDNTIKKVRKCPLCENDMYRGRNFYHKGKRLFVCDTCLRTKIESFK